MQNLCFEGVEIAFQFVHIYFSLFAYYLRGIFSY